MKFSEVKNAVRAYMAALDSGESSTSWVAIRLGGELGISMQSSYTGNRNTEGEQFTSQVSRALGQLAAEGYLIKSVRCTVGRRREAHWTRQDVMGLRAHAAAQANARRVAARAAEMELITRLAIAGFEVTVTGGNVVLAPEEAVRLLELAEDRQ